jgi:hypothetical protein
MLWGQGPHLKGHHNIGHSKRVLLPTVSEIEIFHRTVPELRTVSDIGTCCLSGKLRKVYAV